MIQLKNLPLPDDTLNRLQKLQRLLDEYGDYSLRVAVVEGRFNTQNKPANLIFREVRRVLLEMSSGAERCHYCEDSKANQVEHIAPKSWYPELCFVWENYCTACGPCNSPKNNQFAVFRNHDGRFFEFEKRKKGEPVFPPPPGRHVLINPRIENPLDFFFLDIESRSFRIVEWAEEGSEEFERAQYTIKILGLNSRSYLPKARREAYESYRARLSEYVAQKNAGASPEQLASLADNLRQAQHPTVWAEMKRQRRKLPELRLLFEQVGAEIERGDL